MLGIANIGRQRFIPSTTPTSVSTPGDGYIYYTFSDATIVNTSTAVTSYFKVTKNVPAIVLMIGAGGSGQSTGTTGSSNQRAWAGGAGGQVTLNSNITLCPGTYTLTIPQSYRPNTGASTALNPYASTSLVGPTGFTTLQAYSGYSGGLGAPAFPTSGWTRTGGWHHQGATVYKGGRYVTWQNSSYGTNYLKAGGGASQNANGDDQLMNGTASTDTTEFNSTTPPQGSGFSGGAGASGTTVFGVVYGAGGNCGAFNTTGSNAATYGSGGQGGASGSSAFQAGAGGAGAVIVRVRTRYV